MGLCVYVSYLDLMGHAAGRRVCIFFILLQVNPGSKAAQKGIREGDLVTSINGQSTRGLSNAEAHGLLKSAGGTLTLGLNE